MLGPRYSDPANRQSNFAVAVGSALSGFSGAQDYVQKRKQQAQSDEDRQREIDREAKSDAEREYEMGISATPGAAPDATAAPAQQGVPAAPVAPLSPATPASPALGGGDVAPQPDLNFGQAVGQALGAPAAPAQPPATARPVAPTEPIAPVTSAPAQGGGIRSAVGSILGRIGSNLSTGGYQPHQSPTYNVTRTGPSAKEREEGVRESGENAREGVRAGALRDVAAGNNRTAIEVANIGADSRQKVAAAKAQADQRAKLSMAAINNQVGNTDRAIAQLEKEYDKAEPGLIDKKEDAAAKRVKQSRIQVQIDRLRQQRGNLAQQQQTMMLGMAMGVTDFSGLLPQPTPMGDPNDETQMSDADLWQKKVHQDGMTREQATTYVRQRQRGP